MLACSLNSVERILRLKSTLKAAETRAKRQTARWRKGLKGKLFRDCRGLRGRWWSVCTSLKNKKTSNLKKLLDERNTNEKLDRFMLIASKLIGNFSAPTCSLIFLPRLITKSTKLALFRSVYRSIDRCENCRPEASSSKLNDEWKNCLSSSRALS